MPRRKTEPIAQAITAVEQLASGGNLRAVRMLVDGTLDRLHELVDAQAVADAPPPIESPRDRPPEPHAHRAPVFCPHCKLWFSATVDPAAGTVTDCRRQQDA